MKTLETRIEEAGATLAEVNRLKLELGNANSRIAHLEGQVREMEKTLDRRSF